jgi:protocatechuate 3,4-dioxygenase beta subunit
MKRALPFLVVAPLLYTAVELVAQEPPQAPDAGVFVPLGGAGTAQRPGLPGRPGGLPPRDPRAGAATGTGVVRGRVTAAGSTAPLRRAQVMLMAPELQLRRSTTTDAEGRYEFVDLPPGRYMVSVNKGGYVTLEYGQRRPYEPGTPVMLADGQALTSINVALPRGSVIAGRITDEFGEPIAQAQVQALRFAYGPDGQRRPQPAGGAQTDDLGNFRVFGLMPGEYIVSASTRELMGIAIGLNSIDTGESYVASYHPGTTNINEAQMVTAALGQETTVQFSLVTGRMSRVGGTVVDSSGRPATGAMVLLFPATGFPTGGLTTAQTGTDGSFTLTNVAPGDYQLSVQPILNMGSDGRGESASVPVSVGGSDLMNLRVTTSRGATVTGRVIFEGPSPRTGMMPLRVMTQPAEIGRAGFGVGVSVNNGAVAEDGAFELSGGQGQVFFRVSAPPAWTIKSVTLEGVDITDTPTELTGRDGLSGLVITLTDKLTDVSGQVTDARGRALKDYAVVVQPAEPKPGAAMTRYLRVVRPDQEGRFRVRGLPPGAYEATAIESIEQGRQFVPDVQARLRDTSKRFTVREGETVALDLKLTEGFE